MKSIPVILIFDVGKTNKKVLLFDEQYRLVLEKCVQLPESKDEDGDACEDIALLSGWLLKSFEEVASDERFEIKGINFSAYGASFIYVDDYSEPIAPLYSYLKPFPPALREQFYRTYGGTEKISRETASPELGSLNSGMQLYRLKYEQPELFNRVKYALHLPQYLSYLITGAVYSDITSVGCHTMLWDFEKNDYHHWVYQEGLDLKLAPIYNGDEITNVDNGAQAIPVGIGLHDSSAALIPYLANFHEPFILLSTGTWCISLNPFNQAPLTQEELQQDCLSYIQYQGKPVKASRLFAGNEHEVQTARLAERFNVSRTYYSTLPYNAELMRALKLKYGSVEQKEQDDEEEKRLLQQSAFEKRDIQSFATYEEAYHQLVADLVQQQVASTRLVLNNSPVKRIFVDGGFSKNQIYMHLLAESFPETEVFAASIAQATAMGAAIAIHKRWNRQALPGDIIDLKYYAVSPEFLMNGSSSA